MRHVPLLFALALGIGMTFILFVAVGALNEASVPVVDEATPRKTAAQIVVSPPKKTHTPPPRIRTSVRTRVARQAASLNRVRASVLPALGAQQTGLSLGSALPDIGEVGLGQVNVPETPSTPDRPARARHTVTPIYPLSAQRSGIEGYVTVRLNVDQEGRVKNVIVVDSEPIGVFEKSARRAARRFEFVPARADGKLVPTTLEKKIVFSLQ